MRGSHVSSSPPASDLGLKVLRHSKCCVFPSQAYEEPGGFWAPLEYLGNEMTGLLMTKTKTQRGLVEPVTHIRKPRCIQVETGEWQYCSQLASQHGR